MIKEKYTIRDFVPLVVLFLVILLVSGGTVLQSGDWMRGMRYFMGSFFVIFGLLKIIHLHDFADAYQMYDIVAMRSRVYALLYPFIELALGFLYIAAVGLVVVNIVTLVVMLVSAVGVYLKLRQREPIMCACLGTVFKVPMTWVTLFEDLLMALMAFVMLIVIL